MAAAEKLYSSDTSAARPATSLFDRPGLFWALALFFAAIYFHGQWLGFQQLDDLSTLSADNGLRLQEVRDLAQGQSWFDTHQYRYLPPEGTRMHWSRLVDAPLAAGLLALTPVLGSGLAERVVLTAWPTLLFALYCALTFAALRRTFGLRAALLAIAIAPNYLAFRDLFGAGEIDHHNVQVVLTLTSVLCFAIAASRPIAAVLGGIASALALAVGLESLPYVALIGLVYAAAFVVDRRQAHGLALFASALALASLAAFAVETAPSLWLTPTCDTLSAPWLLLTFGAGAIALAAVGTRLAAWQARLAALAVASVALVGAFAFAFPACLAGPYGAVPDSVLPQWLEATGEALDFGEAISRHPMLTAIVFGPTLAAAIAAWIGALQSRGEGRRLLFATASLLTLTLALSSVQIRAIYVGCALVPVAAGFALDRVLSQATDRQVRIPRALALLVGGALLFEMPWVSAAALAEHAELVAPAPHHDPDAMRACLRELPALRTIPKGTILGPLDLGAHVLFLTDDSIIAAGYHRNVEGIVAGIEAFAGSEADMRKFALRDHADYVAVCLPWVTAYPDRYGAFVKALARGEAAPAWLAPVPLDARALKLWRVTER